MIVKLDGADDDPNIYSDWPRCLQCGKSPSLLWNWNSSGKLFCSGECADLYMAAGGDVGQRNR